MSELRLYCDLLVQQVQTIQTQYPADTEATPTVEVAHLLFHLNDVTFGSLKDLRQHLCSFRLQASLLSATCATFIRTLEECMTLANQSLTPDLRPTERVPTPLSAAMFWDLIINDNVKQQLCHKNACRLLLFAQMKRSISHPGTYNFDR